MFLFHRVLRSSFLTGAICVVALAGLMAGLARADTRAIADDTALRAALAGGVGGDTLVLAPGQYGPLHLHGGRDTAPAALISADPDRPAEIIGLSAVEFDGLRLENLHLRYRFSAGDEVHVRPFLFRGCAGLEIVSTRIEGDEARGIGPITNGLPYGSGLSITGCQDIVLSDLHISRFVRGLVVRNVRGLSVTGSELTALRSDGMNFAQVEDVVIEGNYIHSFQRSDRTGDHSDMIQFWTTGTDRPSRNIAIRNNLLHSGPGLYTQSIFMRNELVDQDIAGPEMFYQDVLIEENVIINAHLHGITIGATSGLTIARNTLAHNPLSAGDDPSRPLWRPAIRVAGRGTDVRIRGNLAAEIIGFADQPDWRMGDNLLIQDTTSLAPGFYGRVFVGMPGGDPLDLANFRYRPGGEAANPALGAAVLR